MMLWKKATFAVSPPDMSSDAGKEDNAAENTEIVYCASCDFFTAAYSCQQPTEAKQQPVVQNSASVPFLQNVLNRLIKLRGARRSMKLNAANKNHSPSTDKYVASYMTTEAVTGVSNGLVTNSPRPPLRNVRVYRSPIHKECDHWGRSMDEIRSAKLELKLEDIVAERDYWREQANAAVSVMKKIEPALLRTREALSDLESEVCGLRSFVAYDLKMTSVSPCCFKQNQCSTNHDCACSKVACLTKRSAVEEELLHNFFSSQESLTGWYFDASGNEEHKCDFCA